MFYSKTDNQIVICQDMVVFIFDFFVFDLPDFSLVGNMWWYTSELCLGIMDEIQDTLIIFCNLRPRK